MKHKRTQLENLAIEAQIRNSMHDQHPEAWHRHVTARVANGQTERDLDALAKSTQPNKGHDKC